jgi:hypothetical protein
MSSAPVLTEHGLKSALLDRGCTPTSRRTGTATIWKTAAGLHFTVPDSLDGYYPDWMIEDVERVVGKIDAWSKFNRRQ